MWWFPYSFVCFFLFSASLQEIFIICGFLSVQCVLDVQSTNINFFLLTAISMSQAFRMC